MLFEIPHAINYVNLFNKIGAQQFYKCTDASIHSSIGARAKWSIGGRSVGPKIHLIIIECVFLAQTLVVCKPRDRCRIERLKAVRDGACSSCVDVAIFHALYTALLNLT